MKRILTLALILIASVCSAAYQPIPSFVVTGAGVASAAQIDSDGNLKVVIASSQITLSGGTPAHVTPSGVATSSTVAPDGSGNVTVVGGSLTANNTLLYFNVGSPTSYGCALATSAVTLLSSLASFTANTYVEIQGTAAIHYATYNTAAATMQNYTYLNAGEVKGFRIGTSTFDLAIIADKNGPVASFAMNIHPLY